MKSSDFASRERLSFGLRNFLRVAPLGLLVVGLSAHLAAQVSYMRPVEWVRYKNVNGVPATRTVWMNLGGVTLRGSRRVGQPRIHHQAMAVLHQQVPHMAEMRRLA